MLSRYASAITWLVLQGFDPNTLADGLAQEGGVAACATRHAAWRRGRRTEGTASGSKAAEQRNAPEAVAGKSADGTAIKAPQTGETSPEPHSATALSAPTAAAAAPSNEDKPRLEAVRIHILPEVHDQILRGASLVTQGSLYGRFTRVRNVLTLVELSPFMSLLASGRLSERRPLRLTMPKRPGSASGAS